MRVQDTTTKVLEVRYFERKPGARSFSLERVFASVRDKLPGEVGYIVKKCPFRSEGILSRLGNMFWAAFHAGRLNHITGDIHYLALALPKKSTIITVHDCGSLLRMKGFRRWVLRLLWYRLPLLRAGTVTSISEFTKAELVRLVGCSPAKIHVIHDPVAAEFGRFEKTFSSTDPIILHLGTDQNKNLLRVVEALKTIPCHLKIVGPLDQRHRNLLRSSGIRYSQHDSVSDEEIVELYRECDVVVFVSTYEGFGLPIVEAQAVGRPVVTSNLSSMPEVAGKGACFVDPFDVESIRAGVWKVIEDAEYRGSIVEAGFENVKRFMADRIAREYASLYQSVSAQKVMH